MARRKPYTYRTIILDCFCLLVSGGVWAIWMVMREIRQRS